MDDRELGIVICAYLKSIIESGVGPDEWQDLLESALKVHSATFRNIRTKQKETKKNGK